MKKIILVSLCAGTLLYGFDFGAAAKTVLQKPAKTETQKSSESSLSSSTIVKGLKEALDKGIDYGIKELSKKDGYLNNKEVKIALPKNLKKAEKLVRKAGGEKIADDLIVSMNSAATQAAPKTAKIFLDAVEKMSIEDAKNILAGDKDAATNYFKIHTIDSLVKTIQPIVQNSMKENSVVGYYNAFNEYYKEYGSKLIQNSSVIGVAKSVGADKYLPSGEDQDLDRYVTKKAIEGLFTMIAAKESAIRENPVEQTTAILKQVFGI